MTLEEKFKLIRNSVVECDKALRELEQKSKIVAQHVDTSIFAIRSKKDKKKHG